MITFRYGPVDGQAPDGKRGSAADDRPNTLDLQWPEWAITGGPTWGFTTRRHTIPVRGGAYTEILGSDPALSLIHI